LDHFLLALLAAAVVAAILIANSWIYGVERPVLFWSGGAVMLVAVVVTVAFGIKSGLIFNVCGIAFAIGLVVHGFGVRYPLGPFDPGRHK
jgi:hypothetical protein